MALDDPFFSRETLLDVQELILKGGKSSVDDTSNPIDPINIPSGYLT